MTLAASAGGPSSAGHLSSHINVVQSAEVSTAPPLLASGLPRSKDYMHSQ